MACYSATAALLAMVASMATVGLLGCGGSDDSTTKPEPTSEPEPRLPMRDPQELVEIFAAGPPAGEAYVWYWWHFWGRSEVHKMTLEFAGVPYNFTGFTNVEWDAMRPLLLERNLIELSIGPLPVMQIDGLRIFDSLAACRYVAQNNNLYPDPTDAKAVVKIETLLQGAQSLFQSLVDHHYKNYNKKGGARAPSTEEDREAHAERVATRVANFFTLIETEYLGESGDLEGEASLGGKADDLTYLIPGKLTIADLFVCHYRYLIEQPEFWPKSKKFFEGPQAQKFQAYYTKMTSGQVGDYFRTRYGTNEHPDRERTAEIVEEESRLGVAGLSFPFQW